MDGVPGRDWRVRLLVTSSGKLKPGTCQRRRDVLEILAHGGSRNGESRSGKAHESTGPGGGRGETVRQTRGSLTGYGETGTQLTTCNLRGAKTEKVFLHPGVLQA